MKEFIYNKSLEEIEIQINKFLKIKQDKKVIQGEVFTPFHLIIEMIEKLPKMIWKNPKLKWLDPGCGIGNFSMCVYFYLNNGLKSWESNDEKRHNHIIQKMLYMIEIDNENIKIAKSIFGNTCNIIKCDYLNIEEWKNKIEIPQFDIIYGNPPYNKNGMRGKGRSNPGLSVIWNKFVELSLKILNEKGFCLFFTPNSWTELKSPLSRLIMNHQIEYIKNFDTPNAYKLFEKKAGSLPLCYYLIKNISPYKSTYIHDNAINEFVEFDVNKYNFIPNNNISLVNKVIKKTKDNLENLFQFTPPKIKKDIDEYSNEFSNIYSYPLINYVHKKIKISYSKTPSIFHNGRPKLVLPNYSMGYPILDKDGIIDVGGRSSYVIFVKDNNIEHLQKIQKFFITDLALTLINSLKTAQKFLSTRTFILFPDPKEFNFEINDSSLEKYFNLNSNDKNAIEKQVTKGEGNLTEERREEIMKFSLKNYLNQTQINEIKEKIKKHNKNNKSMRKTKKRYKKRNSI